MTCNFCGNDQPADQPDYPPALFCSFCGQPLGECESCQ